MGGDRRLPRRITRLREKGILAGGLTGPLDSDASPWLPLTPSFTSIVLITGACIMPSSRS